MVFFELHLLVALTRLALSRTTTYITELLPLLYAALSASGAAVVAYWQVIRHVLLPLAHLVLRLCVISLPLLTSMVRHMILAFTAQPRGVVMAHLSIFIFLSCLVVITRRLRGSLYRAARSARAIMVWMSESYSAIGLHVRVHSKAATRAIPHALFVASAVMVHALFFAGGRVVLLGAAISSDRHSWWRNLELLSTNLLRTVGLVLVAVVLPMMRSFHLLYTMVAQHGDAQVDRNQDDEEEEYRKEDDDKNRKCDRAQRARTERRVLRFWIIMAVAWVTRCAMHKVMPYFALVRDMLAAIDVALFYAVLWAQLGFTTGADLLYVALAWCLRCKGFLQERPLRVANESTSLLWKTALLGRHGGVGGGGDQRLNDNNNNDAAGVEKQFGVLLRVASSLGVADWLHTRRIWRFLMDSGLAAGLFILFALTPRYLAMLLTVLVGVAWPCVRSAATLDLDDDGDSDEYSSSSSNISPSSSYEHDLKKVNDDAARRRQKWLAYWSVYAVVDLAYVVLGRWVAWLQLWPHAKMATVVWLQVDDFAGAVTALDRAIACYRFVVMSIVRQTPAIVTPCNCKLC